MTNIGAANGVARGEVRGMSRRQPSPGGDPSIAPTRGQPKVRVNISTTPGKLSIDSSQCRHEIGYRYPVELAYERAAFANQQAQRGIADTVGAGDALSMAVPGSNVIADLAFQRMLLSQSDIDFQFAMIPLTPPSITFTPGTVSIDFIY